MKKYFISNKTKKDGPFSADEIKGLNLTDEYSVWCEGMDNWVKISEVDELNACFTKSPPPTQAELSKSHLITCIKNTTKATLLVHLLIGTLIFIITGGYLSGNDLVSIYSQPKLANLEAIYFADGWDAKRFYLIFSYLYTLPISILIGYFIYKKIRSDTDYAKKAIKIIIMTIAILIPIIFMSSYTYHKTVYPELFETAYVEAPAEEAAPAVEEYFEEAPAPEENKTEEASSKSDDTNAVSIGDSYGGGIVFYILKPDDAGYMVDETHGLIAARSDLSGTYNSRDAITACENYNIIVDGVTHDDWYLPSKNELNILYHNKTVIGGFTNNFYWSSSEDDSDGAWSQYFGNGNQGDDNKITVLLGRVRAVRAF